MEELMMSQQGLIDKMVDFIRSIGISVEFGEIPEKTFLPGIFISKGALVVDKDKLRYPGDLLHEAGHLAVVVSERRSGLCDDVSIQPAEEMMAIAWSFAAARHINLDLNILFHPDGYKGGSESLIENFSNGYYFGVPMLQWHGLTAEGKVAEELGVPEFPHMIKWLCD